MTGGARGEGRVRLRPGRPADAPAVARVMRAAVRGLPAAACTPRQRVAWSSLPSLYHRWAMGPGGERYLVAERGGRVVGYAAYLGPGARRGAGAARTAELTAVFVAPAAGGAGLGRRLVRAVEARARRMRAPALTVLAARPAAGFYAALRFVRKARTSAPLPGGVRLPAVRMRKAILHPRARPGGPPHRARDPR